MSDTSLPAPRWTLRDLPLAARLTLAAFLISAGLGYFSALVNLHFQEARPGKLLPDDDDVLRSYRGKSKFSQLERLLLAHPSLPFNGQGSMRAAFTTKASGTKADIRKKAKELKAKQDDPKVEQIVARERDGERLALIVWVHEGAKKGEYEADRFRLTGKLADLPITPRFVEEENGQRFAKVKSILDTRCVRCHSESVGGPGAQYSLENYEDVQSYCEPEKSAGKSLAKLAMTTHVHLLGFSLLYGLTGLILALTNLPGWIRLPLAPLALVAQVVDIAFWWLARMDEPHGPMFALGIPITGAIVAGALGLQILLSLWGLFRWSGRFILVLLFAATVAGGVVVKQKVIDPYLAEERSAGEVERE
jgi:hypothetical protein